MKITDITKLLELDFDIRNALLVKDEHVVPPVPYICKSGDKLYSRLFCIEKGEMLFFDIDDRKKLKLKASMGDIIYLPNNTAYYSEWRAFDVGSYKSLLFNIEIKGETVNLAEDVVLMVSDSENLYTRLFSDMDELSKSGALGYRISLKAKAYELIKSIAVSKMKTELKAKYGAIYKGIMHLENNFLEDIPPSELAEMCHVSEGTFRRLFKEYKGESPVKYRNNLRIKKAYELIASGECTVTEASELVNIPDIAYFSKLFKKSMGFNPSELKK